MKTLILVFGILLFAASASATCIVQVQWTPSPDAAREILMLDNAEKVCPNPGECEFVVSELEDQKIIIRSYNSQGNHVDSEPYTLAEENLPTRAVIISVTTTCTQ